MYVGRFAPSPTGPLHFGSLVAAVGSYLEALHHGGRWLVRIEDIDPPREVAGATGAILQTLEAYGFEWDGEVMFQSRRGEAYETAIETLRRQDLVYGCTCSRRAIAEAAAARDLGPSVYPGTCRNRRSPIRPGTAIRVRVTDESLAFEDALQGRFAQRLEREVGDFPIRRADGLFAYQLAVVVDDAAQGITHVVRGSDLLDSTPRQIHLQRLLELPTPEYLHLPVAVDGAGQKLSKQNLAPPLDDAHPVPSLIAALAFLGQEPQTDLADADLSAAWRWAREHWEPGRIPRRLAVSVKQIDG